MARLLVHVEGQTEETFVNEVLRDHLLSRGYISVSARIVGNARLRQRRGGIRAWPSVKRDIANHLREDPHCIATTMVDYYGLPQGEDDSSWPGRSGISTLDTSVKASRVETALLEDLAIEMGSKFDRRRFVPFVVMHEFEGLLFSDCAAFAKGIGHPNLEHRFRSIRESFVTPEDINDSPITSPSKRVLAVVPDYEKPLFGVIAALQIGLAQIRRECPHFDFWIRTLETLSAS